MITGPAEPKVAIFTCPKCGAPQRVETGSPKVVCLVCKHVVTLNDQKTATKQR